VAEQCIRPGMGTDNGSAFTARAARLVLSALGVAHRRGGYRHPESQAFIESWFRYLKERCVWRHDARDPRPGPGGDRRLHRPLPRPAPQPAELPNTPRGQSHVGRCTRSTTKHRGLTCQRQAGALHAFPIPLYDGSDSLHEQLASLGEQSAIVAASVGREPVDGEPLLSEMRAPARVASGRFLSVSSRKPARDSLGDRAGVRIAVARRSIVGFSRPAGGDALLPLLGPRRGPHRQGRRQPQRVLRMPAPRLPRWFR
jgi:hypothetical protein